jgi:hypothetical protein
MPRRRCKTEVWNGLEGSMPTELICSEGVGLQKRINAQVYDLVEVKKNKEQSAAV